MAGPTRRLVFDIDRFESHLSRILHDRTEAIIDVRADAYGLGQDMVCRVISAVGNFALILDGDNPPLDPRGEPLPDTDWVSGTELFGVGHGMSGFTSFIGTVINVKRVPAGRRISYGYTYTTKSPSTVALVALGYADGVLRRASNVAHVRVGEHTGVIAGRIAMDQLVVDLGDVDVKPGDSATLWGDPELGYPSLSDWSELTGVSPLAIMSGIGPRVTRDVGLPRGVTS